MIRVSDIVPRAMQGITSPPSGKGVASASPDAWLDGAATIGDLRISAELGERSRGLSVSQHAAQVLACLCVSADDHR